MTKKLIIIDDSATQLNILKATFANKGWEVCGIQSAKIGYEMIFDFAPDLIITDAIMPVMGGFQLIKLIRENDKISKIPVIVYSVLNEANAKFYIKEELSEYFLRKDDNHEELLKLAEKLTEKFPLDKEYKDDILRIGLDIYKNKHIEEETEETKEAEENFEEIQEENMEETPAEEQFGIEDFIFNLKNIDLKYSDEKIFKDIFLLFNQVFKYDLAIINIFSFEDEENKIFFDIKNIILSPIFKDFILNKFNTKTTIMYKKYAPNLPVVVQENEFPSKLEFNFKYKEKNIGYNIFYSKEKSKWENEEEITTLKDVIYEFLKSRYNIRNTEKSQNENIIDKYFSFNQFKNIKNEQNVYFGIIQIANFSNLINNLSQEELDTVNSKISEKIINYLKENEKIYRNYEDQYDIVIYANDKEQLKHRLEFIAEEINMISYNEYNVKSTIVATSCIINDTFNILEAQKNAREILETGVEQENVVII